VLTSQLTERTQYFMATVSTSENMSVPSSSSNTEASGIHVEVEENFLNSGRTGRRNAIPDIYCSQARVSTAELPTNFARLSCEDTGAQQSPSSNIRPDS